MPIHKLSIQNTVHKYKKKYKLLKPVYCQALNDYIYFTAEGFNHLLYKKGHRRSNKQICFRLPLVNLVLPTILKCKSSSKIIVIDEIYKNKSIMAMYFELSAIVGKDHPIKIKVIIKKRGKLGKLFFFSVMKQKTPKKRR